MKRENRLFSLIRQKDESQNGCFKKAKHAKISGGMFAFLKHPFCDSSFCLITEVFRHYWNQIVGNYPEVFITITNTKNWVENAQPEWSPHNLRWIHCWK